MKRWAARMAASHAGKFSRASSSSRTELPLVNAAPAARSNARSNRSTSAEGAAATAGARAISGFMVGTLSRTSVAKGPLLQMRYLRDTLAMIKRTIRIALVAAGVAMLATGCGKPRVAPLPAGTTVLALGDSLTYGTGATVATSYPAYLAATTRWNVVNGGVPGDTAQQGCDRLQ